MGHAGSLLTFVNNGTPCTISGYPTVATVSIPRVPGYQATQTLVGYLGSLPTERLPTIRLATGETASALLEGLATGCPAEDAGYPDINLVVTPPHNSQAIASNNLEAPYPCSLQVLPVVPTGPLRPIPATPSPENPDPPDHIVDAFEKYRKSDGG
jgi:hypothetical protein